MSRHQGATGAINSLKGLVKVPLHTVLLLVFGWLLAMSPLHAATTMTDLYAVDASVVSQSSAELSRATGVGLKTVLVRIAGNEAVLREPSIKAALKSPRRYLRQFRYQTGRGDEGISELQAHLDFEPALIESLLTTAGQPIWSKVRPNVLLWLIVQEKDGRVTVNAETAPELEETLQFHARRRGLPVSMPLLDLEDSTKVSAKDLWAQNIDRVKTASARYGAEVVLIGKATRLSNGNLLGSWWFLSGKKAEFFDSNQQPNDGFASQVMDRVANVLASRYAVSSAREAQGGYIVKLSDINNFADYAQAVQYLESMAGVKGLDVLFLDSEKLIVNLHAQGEKRQLVQALALNRDFIRDRELVDQHYPLDLHYRWAQKNRR